MTHQAIAPALAPAGNARANRELGDLRLGIVGAGKFATTVARAAVAAGYDVAMSGSGPAEDIVLAPGAHATTTDEVVCHADIIVLAIPTHRFRELPRDLFDGKILIDAMNYWEPVDGDDPELTTAPGGTSTVVQHRFPAARVVKSLNQLGYHELDEHRRPRGSPDRVAVAAAGEDQLAIRSVMRLVDRLGFDPVDAGPLENGRLPNPTDRRSPSPTPPTSSQTCSQLPPPTGLLVRVNSLCAVRRPRLRPRHLPRPAPDPRPSRHGPRPHGTAQERRWNGLSRARHRAAAARASGLTLLARPRARGTLEETLEALDIPQPDLARRVGPSTKTLPLRLLPPPRRARSCFS
jgi:8-hydroxy-5-deazaflavin:NADPH oxidoreductase